MFRCIFNSPAHARARVLREGQRSNYSKHHASTVKMNRRSDRRKTKSLKAELEDSAQIKYKMMKSMGQRKKTSEVSSAEVGTETRSSTSEENEEEVECHSRTRQCVGDIPDSQRKNKRVKKTIRDVSSESGQGEADLKSEQEDEFPEREDVHLLSSEGRRSHYPTLCRALPGRERQIQLLLTLFGEVCFSLSHSLVLWLALRYGYNTCILKCIQMFPLVTEYTTSLLSPTQLLTLHCTCMATWELERH